MDYQEIMNYTIKIKSDYYNKILSHIKCGFSKIIDISDMREGSEFTYPDLIDAIYETDMELKFILFVGRRVYHRIILWYLKDYENSKDRVRTFLFDNLNTILIGSPDIAENDVYLIPFENYNCDKSYEVIWK